MVRQETDRLAPEPLPTRGALAHDVPHLDRFEDGVRREMAHDSDRAVPVEGFYDEPGNERSGVRVGLPHRSDEAVVTL